MRLMRYMSLTDREKQTVDYYDREAENWTTAHGESYRKEEMEIFHRYLPEGRVLEIGSGSGKDAAALIAMGYDYVGTDVSKGLIKIARKKNPGARFEHLSVYDLNFPEHYFDGFWTAATLLHIPKDRIDWIFQRVKTQVKPEGVGFISVKKGEGEKTEEKTGRFFAYYSLGEFSEVLKRNGYEILESSTRQGEKDVWLCCWVRVR